MNRLTTFKTNSTRPMIQSRVLAKPSLLGPTLQGPVTAPPPMSETPSEAKVVSLVVDIWDEAPLEADP